MGFWGEFPTTYVKIVLIWVPHLRDRGAANEYPRPQNTNIGARKKIPRKTLRLDRFQQFAEKNDRQFVLMGCS